jgi:hypothetical protein
MRYLGNGIGHRSTLNVHFNNINAGPSSLNSSAEVGEVDENSESDDDVGMGELEGVSDGGSDGEIEEIMSDEDDDYGYNHNRLIHEDNSDDDTDGIPVGENDEEYNWESMYMD